jgi:hypothetical protein
VQKLSRGKGENQPARPLFEPSAWSRPESFGG